MSEIVTDKNGREIRRGDIVKVYHSMGARRKRYYMYKQCLGIDRYLPSGTAVIKFDHLDMGVTPPYDEYGPKLSGYEIIQGAHDDYESREVNECQRS